VRRAEEVQAYHVLWTPGERSDRVQVEHRGVGGQDGAGLGDRVQTLEDLALDGQVFEHGFDHQVCLGHTVVVDGAGNQGDAGKSDFGAELAALCRAFVVFADGLECPLQGGRVALDQ